MRSPRLYLDQFELKAYVLRELMHASGKMQMSRRTKNAQIRSNKYQWFLYFLQTAEEEVKTHDFSPEAVALRWLAVLASPVGAQCNSEECCWQTSFSSWGRQALAMHHHVLPCIRNALPCVSTVFIKFNSSLWGSAVRWVPPRAAFSSFKPTKAWVRRVLTLESVSFGMVTGVGFQTHEENIAPAFSEQWGAIMQHDYCMYMAPAVIENSDAMWCTPLD